MRVHIHGSHLLESYKIYYTQTQTYLLSLYRDKRYMYFAKHKQIQTSCTFPTLLNDRGHATMAVWLHPVFNLLIIGVTSLKHLGVLTSHRYRLGVPVAVPAYVLLKIVYFYHILAKREQSIPSSWAVNIARQSCCREASLQKVGE